MKIVSISIIRNEADILETFVRYHLRIVDQMIIINHRSADASLQILDSLKNEGLNLDIRQETALEVPQKQALTKAMKSAVNEHGADWVLPLDADEFIADRDGGNVRDLIAHASQDRVIAIPWRTYIPLPSDDVNEPNLLRRIQNYRKVEKPQFYKIIIPRSLAAKGGSEIATGSHELLQRNLLGRYRKATAISHESLIMAHFPVRSARQITIKSIGWLSWLARPDRKPTEGFQIRNLYHDILINRNEITGEELSKMAMSYASEPVLIVTSEDVLRGGVITESGDVALSLGDESLSNPYAVLARVAEEMADALGSVRAMK